MARPIVLSNGTMHVGINLFGMVHDLYYPHVGYENHSAANKMRHRIGVWVGGEFSWLDDGAWVFAMDYEPHALIGHISAYNEHLGVMLEFSDCVDSELNVFLRNIHVVNARAETREIRLFLHQALLISNSLNADTAQYLPEQSGILLYKGRRSFVVGAKGPGNKTFDQFAIGSFNSQGNEGTYRDAEDGNLGGNPVEHGKVDSVIGFNLTIEGLNSARVNYWLAAAKLQKDAIALHVLMQKGNIAERYTKTAQYWRRWLSVAEPTILTLPKNIQAQARKSLLIIKSHIDHAGAAIASTDTTKLNYERDAYTYFWPRDGVYGLWPLLRLGYKTELKRFFEFCQNALHPEGFLMQKYQPDGPVGATWHPYVLDGRVVPPIQEDETAAVVFLFGQYIETTKDKKALEQFYDSMIVPMANFMASYIDPHTKLPHATYDLWEEKFLTTTYTTALVFAALNTAAGLAEKLKRPQDVVRWQTVATDIHAAAPQLLFNADTKFFNKGFLNMAGKMGMDLKVDTVVDSSSFYAAVMFGLFDMQSPEVTQAFKTLQSTFKLGSDPWMVPRYVDDRNYNWELASHGNPWIINTLWIAQYLTLTGNSQKAQQILSHVQEIMLRTGVLPEQVDPNNHRRFLSIAPLMWSQAEFINTALDLQKAKS